MERREAPGVCETPFRGLRGPGFARQTAGFARPGGEAHAPKSGRFARPAGRTLRLPALHQPPGISPFGPENPTPNLRRRLPAVPHLSALERALGWDEVGDLWQKDYGENMIIILGFTSAYGWADGQFRCGY